MFSKISTLILSLLLAVSVNLVVAPTEADAPAKPSVTRLSVSSGPAAGGTRVTITGKRLTQVRSVRFGVTKGLDVKVRSATSLKVTAPAHAAGVVHVRVVTEQGTSKKVRADRFRFTAPATCGNVTMAVPTATQSWVGYEANAYVVGNVLESLGCTVRYTKVSFHDVLPFAVMNGEVDVVIEDWGSTPHLNDVVSTGVATNLGPTGNVGGGGWYVPPWLAAEHPDILDWENLNDYADQFKTPSSGDDGQFLSMSPFWGGDEAIIDNLGLDFRVVNSGSDLASLTQFRQAERDHTFLIGYFFEPHWGFLDTDLQRVSLPPHTEGCQDDVDTIACDYPELEHRKVVRTAWAETGGPGVELVRNFHWTNDDQNQVARYIAEDGMSPEDAAATWIAENRDLVDAWLD